MFSTVSHILLLFHLNYMYLDSGFTYSLVENVNDKIFSRRPKDPDISNNRTNDWTIVGDKRVDISKYPWVVSLEIDTLEKIGGHLFIRRCSGSLIHVSFVLTAARCLLDRENQPSETPIEGSRVYVRYGSNYRDREGTLLRGKIATIHPEYKKWKSNSEDYFIRNNPHDVGLLQMNGEFKESELAQKKSYITAKDTLKLNAMVQNQVECKIAGWGLTKRDGKFSDRLQDYETHLLVGDKCVDNLAGEEVIEQVHQLCTYTPGETPCKGDEGGALICSGREGVDALVAVYSFVQSCGGDIPVVYTRLDTKGTWIFKVTSGVKIENDEKKSAKNIARFLIPDLGLIFEALFLEIIALKNYLT